MFSPKSSDCCFTFSHIITCRIKVQSPITNTFPCIFWVNCTVVVKYYQWFLASTFCGWSKGCKILIGWQLFIASNLIIYSNIYNQWKVVIYINSKLHVFYIISLLFCRNEMFCCFTLLYFYLFLSSCLCWNESSYNC